MEAPPILTSVQPDRNQRRAAFAVLAIAFVAFLFAAPFAKVQLPAVWAFLPLYQSAYVVVTFVTFILLLGQFRLMRSRALLVLAGAYLFDALMAMAHALSFPGLFAPGGLLGAGTQTTAWLYFFWHGGFPLLIVCYALLKHGEHDPLSADTSDRGAILFALGGAFALAGGMTLLATAGHDRLPVIMAGDVDASNKVVVATLTWLLSLVALGILWRRRPHSLLDLWLMVVVCIWIFDSALAAVLNHGRFDIGWYMGRACGLLASSLVLVMLLLENNALYLRLARQRDEDVRIGSAKLSESEERLQILIDHAPASLAMFDRDMRYLAVSRRWLEDYAIADRDLIGRPHYDVLPELPEAWKAIHRRGLAGEVVRADEDRFERSDGSVQWLRWEVRPWRAADGGVGGIVIFSADITARKCIELELRELNANLEQRVRERTAELERSNRELDDFAYIASHDLKEPLRGLHNYASFLKADYDDRLDDEGRRYLERMQRLAERLGTLIDGLLAYSRLGATELQIAPVDTEKLLDEVAEDIGPFLAGRGVRLIRATPLPSVECNALRLREVFQNLITNAAKYNDKDDKWVEIGCRADRSPPVFYVRDNGIGIAPRHQETVFRIFKRLHEQDKYGGGTGAGLTIVKKIVERHGGRIWLESTPGEGATFYFTLHAEA